MPSISVIIPIHDVEYHVAACITSLRHQNMEDFEALVVDDGSTDQSAEVMQRAIDGDPRFQVISQPNRGLGAARNAGLELASGDYIAFLDGDDRYAPDYLFQQRNALEETGADWVACGIRNCLPDGSHSDHSAIHGLVTLHLSGHQTRWDLDDWNRVIRHFPSAWNKLYRRSLIDGLRFREGTWFEDHGWFYRAAARTDHLLHLAKPLYLQTRGRKGQITASDDERVFDQFPVLEDIYSVMTAPGRAGGVEAFEKIASRLLFERSTALRHPDRRARFATASAQALEDHGVQYHPGWDPHIGRSWDLEMAGELPLSVVIPWSGQQPKLLAETLTLLSRPETPGHEVLVVCDNQKAADEAAALCQNHPQVRVIVQSKTGTGPARNSGLDAARGRYVCFLDAGHQPMGTALQHWVDGLTRSEADFSISAFQKVEDNEKTAPGFLPPGPPPGIDFRAPTTGFTPEEALLIEPTPSSMLFERVFLESHDIRFGSGALPAWQMVLKAALCAQKAIYHPQPGVLVPAGDKGKSTHAGQITRALEALAASLGPERARTLPQGWLRRLFTRAVRLELNRRNGKPGKAVFALAATLTATSRGLTKEYSALDLNTGPRLETLMSLEALLRKLPDTAAYVDTEHPVPDDHSALRTENGARVTFEADFHERPYANISFFESDGRKIPFHLSLRRDQGLAVCNNRIGMDWGPEISRPHDFSGDKTEVEILLRPREASVSINGRQLFHFRARHPFARFSQLARIASLDFQGGIACNSLRSEELAAVAERLDQLDFNDRLELVAFLTAPQGENESQLDIAGTDLRVETVEQAREVGYEIRAVLPGRIWQEIDSSSALDIGLLNADGVELCPRLSLDRVDMAGRIENILCRGPLTGDELAAMLVIEHVRFGNLLDKLSTKAQANLHETAGFFGLHNYLSTEKKPSPLPEALPPTPLDPVTATTTRFTRYLAEHPGADPLEAVLLSTEDQPRSVRREVFLWLGEFFCAPDKDFEVFHALFRTDGHGVDPLPGNDDASRTSALLPFLLIEGRIADLKTFLWSLDAKENHWISTPSLAWALRRAIIDDGLDEFDREAVLSAALKVIGHLANNYWGRTHCIVLIEAVASMLGQREVMTGHLARDVEAAAIRAYALSQRFWQALENGNVPLGSKLQHAHTSFLAIQNAARLGEYTPDLEKALDTLDALGCCDARRVRREMLGPQHRGEHSRLAQGDAQHIMWQESEALIRNLAFPGAPAADDAAAQRAAQALPSFYPKVPQAPYYDLQLNTSHKIEALLVEAADSDITPAQITKLAPSLRCLAGQRSTFLGIGLIFALMRGLAGKPGHRMALAALTELLQSVVASLEAPARKALSDAALPRMTLQALRDFGSEAALYQEVADCLPDLAEGLPEPARDRHPVQRHAGTPLFDTIVLVFSCHPNLDTRIPALRDSWLRMLEGMGIPYLVIVGGGDGTVDGDVLHLDAPDDYEGLSQKTLAAIRWVHDNTDALHLVKVDDDCFLNPYVFFRSLSYRKFDYYGRVLTRRAGQMDRAWHNEKSTSMRGRFELDKSPEPSTYTDGGSGYALSRTAMAAVLQAMQTPEGQRLQQLSFMEDKLLGDLLALRGITPSEQDYRVSLRRRSGADVQPVARWVNSFFASQAAPVSLVHLDDHKSQLLAMDLLNSTELRPKKIWPSFQNAALVYQSNALELVSDESRLALARDAAVAVIACTRNEMFMLPHFLRHYRNLGVSCFLIADNCSDDGTLEYLLEQPDVVLFSVDTDYSLSQYGVAWQQAMLAAFRVGNWSLVADVDELLVWEHPSRQSLTDLLSEPEFVEADAARVFMLDMYPGGELADATFKTDPFAEAGFVDREPFLPNAIGRGPYSNMPTWTSALRHRLIPGSRPDLFVAQKIALLRYMPWMHLSAGMHYVSGATLATRELVFAHFKYNADFHRKVTEEVSRAQHFNGAEEYRKYLQVLSEGRDVIYEERLSVPWTEAPFIKALLGRKAG